MGDKLPTSTGDRRISEPSRAFGLVWNQTPWIFENISIWREVVQSFQLHETRQGKGIVRSSFAKHVP